MKDKISKAFQAAKQVTADGAGEKVGEAASKVVEGTKGLAERISNGTKGFFSGIKKGYKGGNNNG